MRKPPIDLPLTSEGSAPLVVRLAQPGDAEGWDAFVRAHPQATAYHLFGWREVIEKAYGHRTYYLAATTGRVGVPGSGTDIMGILPLIHLKHFLFGNCLVSMPFFDSGGLLAGDESAELALVQGGVRLGRELKARCIELRHLEPLMIQDADRRRRQGLEAGTAGSNESPRFEGATAGGLQVATRSHKVRMVLDLPDSSENLMNSFKAKLRSQIKKPLKEGLYAKTGGKALLDDFYRVFSENMRDLGSPVHSKRLIGSVLDVFSENARIVIVYKQEEPVAGSVVIGFKQTLANPWASALRKFSRLSPNMLLYWTMLDYACRQGFKQFDFGRSSPEEGTYKFKEQWGAQPHPCQWHYLSLNGSAPTISTDKASYSKMIAYWKKLPVSITRLMGPMIRKHISL